MTTIEYILATVGIITLLFAIIAITLYLLRKFIRPTATTLLCRDKGMLLVKSGRKPIFFSDVKAADAFVKKCSPSRIFWEVYIIDDGEVRHLGSSEKINSVC